MYVLLVFFTWSYDLMFDFYVSVYFQMLPGLWPISLAWIPSTLAATVEPQPRILLYRALSKDFAGGCAPGKRWHWAGNCVHVVFSCIFFYYCMLLVCLIFSGASKMPTLLAAASRATSVMIYLKPIVWHSKAQLHLFSVSRRWDKVTNRTSILVLGHIFSPSRMVLMDPWCSWRWQDLCAYGVGSTMPECMRIFACQNMPNCTWLLT